MEDGKNSAQSFLVSLWSLFTSSHNNPVIRSAQPIVDQPPGTGLSIVPTNGYLHELDQAAAHMIQFLKNFYTVFPELQTVSVRHEHRLCDS